MKLRFRVLLLWVTVTVGFCALSATVGALACLYEREATGLGGWVETSLYDGIQAILPMLIGRVEPHSPSTTLMNDSAAPGSRCASANARSVAGEIMGMDAISTDIHNCSAVALEDSEVCELPFGKLEELGRKLPTLQRHLHRIMSSEIVRDQGTMLLLGSMHAEERLAAFLLNLSQRFAARGYSPSAFQLRMTRQEIGNYLGMKLETVSRTLSRFQKAGLISVRNKAVEILDANNLRSFFA